MPASSRNLSNSGKLWNVLASLTNRTCSSSKRLKSLPCNRREQPHLFFPSFFISCLVSIDGFVETCNRSAHLPLSRLWSASVTTDLLFGSTLAVLLSSRWLDRVSSCRYRNVDQPQESLPGRISSRDPNSFSLPPRT